jgi:hypothetical protein
MGTGWIQGAGGLLAPVQAEAVVITTTDSYAIMEGLAYVKEHLIEAAAAGPHDHIFIEVTPKEGGKALLNVKHIVGFVENPADVVAG